MQTYSSESKINYVSFLFDTNIIDLKDDLVKGFVDHLVKKFSNKFKIYMWRIVVNINSPMRAKSIETYVDIIPDDEDTVKNLFSEYHSYFSNYNIEKHLLPNIRALEYNDKKINIYELQ